MKNIKILRALTLLLSISLTIVSVAGAFFPETYARDSPSMAAQGVGQDLVDLVVAVPLLLLSFFFAQKGKRVATLIYGGTLFYILYSFVIYCFGINFNQFFLFYCLTLSLSLYSFILLCSDLRRMKMEEWFKGAPAGPVSIYMILVALIFYFLWLKSIVPAILHNEVPAEVADYRLPVNPVHVLDLVFALPGLIIGAVLIRKGQGLGYMIASFALVFLILLTLALGAMVLVLVERGISEDYTLALVFAVLSLTSLTFIILLFRSVGRA